MWRIIEFSLLHQSFLWVFDHPCSIQVTDLVRVSCEDGHDFIRRSVNRVYDDPFPPDTGPKPSRLQEEKERKLLRKHIEEGRLIASPPVMEASVFRKAISHFVMNLPDSAISFLNAFRGLLSDESRDLSGVYEQMPMIHCHCFTREHLFEAAQKDIRKVSALHYLINLIYPHNTESWGRN